MNKLILGALISSCWVNLACGMNKNIMEEDSSIESIDVRNMGSNQRQDSNKVQVSISYRGKCKYYEFSVPKGATLETVTKNCETMWALFNKMNSRNNGSQNFFGPQGMNNRPQNFYQNMNNSRNTSPEFKTKAEEQEEKEVKKEEKSNKHMPAPRKQEKENPSKTNKANMPQEIDDDLKELIYEIRNKYGTISKPKFIELIKRLGGAGIISSYTITKIITAHIRDYPHSNYPSITDEELMTKYKDRFTQIIEKARSYQLKRNTQREEARHQREEARHQREEALQQREEALQQKEAQFLNAFNESIEFGNDKLKQAISQAYSKSLNSQHTVIDDSNITVNDLPKYFKVAFEIAGRYTKIKTKYIQITSDLYKAMLRESYVTAFSSSEKDVNALEVEATNFWTKAKSKENPQHKQMRVITNFIQTISNTIQEDEELITPFKEHFQVTSNDFPHIAYLPQNFSYWVQHFE